MIWLRSTIFNICFFSVTAICCLLYLPTLLLPRPIFLKSLSYYFHLLHWLEKKIIRLDCRVVGAENIPKDGAFIVAAKHQSTYETMKIPLLFRDFSVILKRELMWIPLWGWFAAKARMIPVNRGSREKAIQSIIEGALQMKQEGRPIIIFPQGTRVRVDQTPEDKPYKQGVVHMAKSANLPIIPLSLNSGVFWPRKAFLKKPGLVVFEFGKPIEPVGEKREILAKIEQELETRSNRLAEKALKNTSAQQTTADHEIRSPSSRSGEKTRRKKTALEFGLLAILLVALAYTAHWFWYADRVKDTIKSHQEKLAEQGVLLENTPRVSGFPLFHDVTYQGQVTTPLATFDVPYLEITGVTFPGQTVKIRFPKGLEWTENFKGQNTYQLDEIRIRLNLPSTFPEDTSRAAIRAWSREKPAIMMEQFLLRKDPMRLEAQAHLKLNQDLQPDGEVFIISRGHTQLVNKLSGNGELSPKDHIFVQSALKSFSRQDEKTGEKILHLAFEIRNNGLFLGPLKILDVPYIHWQHRSDT